MSNDIKYDVWIIRIMVILGLGCSMLYSTQLFDGVKTAKTFYFIVAVFSMLFSLYISALWKKKDFYVSLSIPDILLVLYAVWSFVRLVTSDTDSIHNLYFWEFMACALWYFCLRSSFVRYIPVGSTSSHPVQSILFVFIVLGYIQLIFCTLQLTGMMSSFSPIFPVSGIFDNTSELCIYLTCILPAAIHVGIRASDKTSRGKFVRVVCLFYVLCWLALVLAMGSRTALLSGIVGLGVFVGFQTGFFGYMKGKIRKTLVSIGLFFMMCGMVVLLTQYKKDSASGRLLIWKVAWLGIKETPLHGQGSNAFQAKYGNFQAVYFQQHIENEKEMMIADNMTVAMNDYVEIAFNLGFIGLLLFVGFWLSLLTRVFTDLDRNPLKTREIASQAHNDVVTVAVMAFVIFLVSSGFYFVEKMLSVKVIALFFAAFVGSISKNILSFSIRSALLKSIVITCLFFYCFAGYATVNKTKHYSQWKKANMLAQFGYMEDARTEYECVYPYMRHNGLFLYNYARNLYENKEYQQCLDYMKIAKTQITGNRFYMLYGDAYFKIAEYENAIFCYEYAANMVPNRFRPLYQLFKLYEKLGETQKAFVIAQNIVNKPIKVYSHEVQQIKKECIDFIHIKKHDQENQD